MYIQNITIKNYRCFSDFSMSLCKGLNVIIGANNSGKTGLLYAIQLLNEPNLSVDDFNKNNLLNFHELYMNDAPAIEIVYTIRHLIKEQDTTDESIIRLLPFLGMDKLSEAVSEEDGEYEYDITATVKVKCSLDIKALGDYRVAVANAADFNGFMRVLKSFVSRYKWSYFNGSSDTEADKKDATGIFDMRYIGAERTSESVNKEARREIDAFTKDPKNALEIENLRDDISKQLKELLKPTLDKLEQLFENENNDIGLHKGNVSIAHDIKPNITLGESYITEVRDKSSDYIVPLEYNGLGYNNLISIYMLIKLTEIQQGRDFRILCLEEPEAHLHPAMQYKLFKYLRNLDEENKLNQQIIVTTHSSNITAVAGLDNMYMIEYSRDNGDCDCTQQSLSSHFDDSAEAEKCVLELCNTMCQGEEPADLDLIKERLLRYIQIDAVQLANETKAKKYLGKLKNSLPLTHKGSAKKHLSKFLDVTRSDMLFADKVILVEGIAEKLLLPLFMERCGYSFEDEFVSIVEIGGKHFEHFVELFNGNAITRRMLCITDRDFQWVREEGGIKILSDYDSYVDCETSHIVKLHRRFPIKNFHIVTQTEGGRTFENELLLANCSGENTDANLAIELFGLVANETVSCLIKEHGLNFNEWYTNRPKAANSVVAQYIDATKVAIDKDNVNAEKYMRIFFAELFYYYASNNKGTLALNILANERLASSIVVPKYIREGLEWLLK